MLICRKKVFWGEEEILLKLLRNINIPFYGHVVISNVSFEELLLIYLFIYLFPS